MERFKLLSDQELMRIDQASRALLRDMGSKVSSEEAMDYYDKVGCHVDKKTGIVKVPDHVINETLAECSSWVRLYDRRGGKPMLIGGDDTYFGTIGVATNVYDIHDDQYRSVLEKDLIDMVQLSDVLPRPDYVTVLATPTEVPMTISDLIESKALLLNTSKHVQCEAISGDNANKTFEMAALIAGGYDKLAEKPFLSMLCCLTSPLHVRKDFAELVMEGAKKKIPLFIEAGPMAGGTGPVMLAGNLVQANAEILNAFVLAKAVNVEVPLIYASWARILDMKVATCSHGGPEFAMQRVGTTQLAKYYGLPCGGGSFLGDARTIDCQLGMEKLGTGLLPALAGMNMCSGMGLFADENAISLETLIFDNEVTGWVRRVLDGIKVNAETCDIDVIKQVGYGGDFVRLKQTYDNYKNEIFIPSIIDRGYLNIEKDPLAKNIRKRAKALYPKLMEKYVGPQVPQDIIEKIDNIIFNNKHYL